MPLHLLLLLLHYAHIVGLLRFLYELIVEADSFLLACVVQVVLELDEGSIAILELHGKHLVAHNLWFAHACALNPLAQFAVQHCLNHSQDTFALHTAHIHDDVG